MKISGNAALRDELDEASRIRLPQVYIETLERLRREFGHSILILPDGSDRITRFNCFAYGLGVCAKNPIRVAEVMESLKLAK